MKNRLTPAKIRAPPQQVGARGGVLELVATNFLSVNFCHGKKSQDKVISNLLNSTKTIVLGRGKVSVTLFWSLVLLYSIDAIKSYEGLHDPAHN